MLLFIGAIVGINLSLRVVSSELREIRLQGRTGLRGDTRLRLGDYAVVARRGLLFVVIPMTIGYLLDVWLGTTVADISQSLQGADVE